MHLVVRAGRAGLRGRGGHDHADMTSPVLSIDGLPVLVDPGTNRYSYSISERLAELSARGHNMVIVDQVDPLPVMDGSVMPMVSARTVGKVEARRRRHALALRTTHDGFAAVPGVHAYSRDFVLDLKSDSLSIRDVLEGMGRHRVESAWHFHPDVLVLREGHRLDLVDRASSQPFAQMTLDDAWETLQLSEYAYSEQYGERVTATRLQLASMMEFPTEVVTKFDSAIESGTL